MSQEFSLKQVLVLTVATFAVGILVGKAPPIRNFMPASYRLEHIKSFIDQRHEYLRSADGMREMIPKLRAQMVDNPNDMTYAAMLYTDEALMDRAERAAVQCKGNKKCADLAMNGPM